MTGARLGLPWLAVVLFAAVACGEKYAPFASKQRAAASAAAARVRPDEVMQRVQELYDARLSDSERDSSHGDLCGHDRGCSYSRVASAQVIRKAWTHPALPALTEQQVTRDGLETTNIYLDLPASRESLDWVLALAHYDAWFGGANDNATGVAITLETAFALQGLELDRNVRLLLTDGEELGMIGTNRYIAEHGTDGIAIVLNADMLAHTGDEGNFITREPAGVEYVLQANETAAAAAFRMADLGRRLPEPVNMRPVVFPDDGVSAVGFAVGSDLSDHAPFWLRGVDALFPFPAGDKPGWYHTPEDTPDKVDVERLRRMSRLWAAAIAAFATAPEAGE
jgi:hypothetical protein